MFGEGNSQNQKIEENNKKIEETNINKSNNGNKNSEENKNQENTNENELKIGQYMLTPLEGILLNKKMPPGYKLETEENVLKSIDALKNQARRYKPTIKYGDSSRRNKQSKKLISENDGEVSSSKRPRKNAQDKNYGGIQNNQVNPESYKIMMKCRKCLDKLKTNPHSSFFYSSNQPGEPSLSNIEKRITNYEYKTLYEFFMDLRKLWSYYFQTYPKEPEIYQKACKMSELSEQICKEMENNNEEITDDISRIKKRVEKCKKDIDEFKDHGNVKENISAPVKKAPSQNNDNKAMTLEEKNQLGNSIRSLNKDQLRGIIKILSDPQSESSSQKSKYFEFDIDKLPPKKLRELEKYVKGCLKETNSGGTNNNQLKSNDHNKSNYKQQQNSAVYQRASNLRETINKGYNETNNKGNNETNKGNVDAQNNLTKSQSKAKKQSNQKNSMNGDSISDSGSMSSDSNSSLSD